MSAFATRYNTATIDGLEVFYREAGDPNNPTLLLLHGFPSSSHMFRNLINSLADEYHLVAPDHIGFGRSAMPTTTQFTYSFDRLTEITEGLIEHLGLDRFALYIHDYGAPIGLRIASRRPERITALITQSGNAYVEGFTPFWDILFAHAKDRAANEEGVREKFTPEDHVLAVHPRRTRGSARQDRARSLAARPTRTGPQGQRRHPAATVLGLPVQPRRLPGVPGVLPHPSATAAGHLGQERRDLRRPWRGSVSPRLPQRRIPPARRRPLRAGNPR